jgi:hypothetical protein
MPVNPNVSQVQSVGDFSASFAHPLLLAAGYPASIGLVGFKLEGAIVDGEQSIDNAKVIPLIGGVVVILTNTVLSGVLTWSSVETTGDPAQGDVAAISRYLQSVGDNIGGTLRVSWSQNATVRARTFYNCVVQRVKPMVLAGNDVPDQGIKWLYGRYTTT